MSRVIKINGREDNKGVDMNGKYKSIQKMKLEDSCKVCLYGEPCDKYYRKTHCTKKDKSFDNDYLCSDFMSDSSDIDVKPANL